MVEMATKVPVKTEAKPTERTQSLRSWPAFDDLHREIDRVFEGFSRGAWLSPFRRSVFDLAPLWRSEIETGTVAPSVDIAETEKAYELTADLPGMEEKNIEVKLVNGSLSIKGEKKEEKEEKKKDYYLQERRFGSFERCFTIPEGVDSEKIEASFKKGVLTVTLPKKAEAIKPEKKIEVKAAA
jgi:HSP20 family protein